VKAKRLECLEELARTMVGDGKSPDLFFVTVGGNVVMISREYRPAYACWKRHASASPLYECALENRQIGVIASVQPEEDDDKRLEVIDDSYTFRKELPRK
jgi:hypothetical protein